MRATLPPLSIARAALSTSSPASAGVMPAWPSASSARSCLDVEDGGERDPRHPEQLGGEPGAHLAGADQADPQRSTRLVEPVLQPVAVTHGGFSLVGGAGPGDPEGVTDREQRDVADPDAHVAGELGLGAAVGLEVEMAEVDQVVADDGADREHLQGDVAQVDGVAGLGAVVGRSMPRAAPRCRGAPAASRRRRR